MDESYINRVFPNDNYLWKVSNPRTVINKYNMLYNEPLARIYPSTRRDKKYMLLHPTLNKTVHFGSILYEDYTKHQDEKRRLNYLRRASYIPGDWKNDKYTPNSLSMSLLW